LSRQEVLADLGRFALPDFAQLFTDFSLQSFEWIG
jgi:hypothetical protein